MKPAAAASLGAAGSGRVNNLLRTPRLTLRPMEQRDAPDLHACFSDPAVMRYFADTHTTLEETENWVRAAVSAAPKSICEYVLVSDGKVIGKAGIWSRPELGFLLQRDHWRRGLMNEALSAFLPAVSESMGLTEITADVDPRNSACLTLLKRLGFTETSRATKTIQIAGHWCDSIYLARDATRY